MYMRACVGHNAPIYITGKPPIQHRDSSLHQSTMARTFPPPATPPAAAAAAPTSSSGSTTAPLPSAVPAAADDAATDDGDVGRESEGGAAAGHSALSPPVPALVLIPMSLLLKASGGGNPSAAPSAADGMACPLLQRLGGWPATQEGLLLLAQLDPVVEQEKDGTGVFFLWLTVVSVDGICRCVRCVWSALIDTGRRELGRLIRSVARSVMQHSCLLPGVGPNGINAHTSKQVQGRRSSMHTARHPPPSIDLRWRTTSASQIGRMPASFVPIRLRMQEWSIECRIEAEANVVIITHFHL